LHELIVECPSCPEVAFKFQTNLAVSRSGTIAADYASGNLSYSIIGYGCEHLDFIFNNTTLNLKQHSALADIDGIAQYLVITFRLSVEADDPDRVVNDKSGRISSLHAVTSQ
jgi:hypothetical protein